MNTVKPFSGPQRRVLARLVGWIIPPSQKYGIPGADDEMIFDTVLDKCLRHEEMIGQGLDRFIAFSQARPGRGEEWAPAELEAALQDFEAENGAFVGVITMIAAQAYYQDARVLRSLDMEARPPFPKGQEIPQGDWSLLDPVKRRGKRYRDA